jgi:7-cyano-7-deazaguanine synthase
VNEGTSAVVLLSGGMDSVTALYDTQACCRLAAAVSFRYGAKHNHREIPCAAWHAERLGVRHHVIPLDFIGDLFRSDLLTSGGEIPKGHYEAETMQQTVVPFRNGILLAIAAGFAESVGAQRLVIAAHAGDHAIYPDCREEFMQAMADAVRLGTYAEVEIWRPFIKMTKADIACRGAELGVDFAQTWSCYVGGQTHCGECGTCVERREAFLVAELPDPTSYLHAGPLPPKPVPA